MKICLSCEGVTDTQAHRCGYCDAPLLPLDRVHYPARRGELDAGNPLLGTIIDSKYRLQSVLGRGGLGTVFRAQHVGSLVTVALKLLHPRFSERVEYRQALLPEARRAATVMHERCARVLDVGEGDEGMTYLVMELVVGQTLDEVMQQGALPPSHALDVLIQVSAALSAVHKVGLVHCDLSPRNVMVASGSGNLDVKVLDFGIARSMNMAGRESQLGELWGFGTPACSAPELLEGGDVDSRADIYSLGALGWFMLTGRMPVDDSDTSQAVAAIRSGHLSDWPRVAGVPSRLTQLIHRCLQFEPDDRPGSVDEIHRQLLSIQTGRVPSIVRLAVVALFLALLLTLATGGDPPSAFLRSNPGSPLVLSDRALANDSPVAFLTTKDLARIECQYGGDVAGRLRVDIARDGEVLAPIAVAPQVDPVANTLMLSVAQQGWQEVVEGLFHASKDGPVDLIFSVPGTPLIRVARVQVDDQPPDLKAEVQSYGPGLDRASRLLVEIEDDIAIASASVSVSLPGQDPLVLPLPASSGSYALGEKLAERLTGVLAQAGGALTVKAVDRAGNERVLAPIAFDSVDVGVPHVTSISGPAGQKALTLDGDKLRFRVRLSEFEPGCSLRLQAEDIAGLVEIPLPESAGAVLSYTLEVTVPELAATDSSVILLVAVVDAAGNSDERGFTVSMVDRSPAVELRPDLSGDHAPSVWTGSELLLGLDGGVVEVGVSAPYSVVGVQLMRGKVPQGEQRLALRKKDAETFEVLIQGVDVGSYRLKVALAEADNEELSPQTRFFDLRVLPRQLEVYVPTTRGRYLKQLIDNGVLMERRAASEQLGQGRAWRLDAELRPYVQGQMWLNGTPREVRASARELLPDFTPVSGRNQITVQLTDVLGRSVQFVDEDGEPLAVIDGRTPIVDFWWSNAPTRLIGESLLVEHGQPLRIRIRFPLPFREEDALRLGYTNGEVLASQISRDGSGSIASFDMTFPVWSAAAKLNDQTPEQFAAGIDASLDVVVATPARSAEQISLSLRTTRSTLSPMRLGDYAEVAEDLRDLRLLPVLAPSREFVEPVPGQPPRFSYRPQWPVRVRNMKDILLQQGEFEWGQARALVAVAKALDRKDLKRSCVHHFDPLGMERLSPQHLLPVAAPGAAPQPDAALLTGVDFFQAWALSRLLGVAVAKDPSLFRLPFGCELELAAFGEVRGDACHGARARGGEVQAAAFLPGWVANGPWTLDRVRSTGDVVATSYGVDFVGLDFGVREWVLDLPHIPGAERLLATWTEDHAGHLSRVMGIAQGQVEMLPTRLGLQRKLAAVRGLAFGEADGAIDPQGRLLDLKSYTVLPDSVPGVLRTEQLSRDGRDLLSGTREPRLQHVGFRLVADAKKLANMWGYR